MPRNNKKRKYDSPSLFQRTEEKKAVQRLEARGYTNMGAACDGIMLQRISAEGFVEQVKVDLNGRIRKYQPWKPSPMEQARLSKLTESR